jgi:hypothetical protein
VLRSLPPMSMSQVRADPDRPDRVYATLRPLLLSIAYQMVGAVSEAEDIVQKACRRRRCRFHVARGRDCRPDDGIVHYQ